MNRIILPIFLITTALCCLWSCSKGESTEKLGQPYVIKGTVMLDSSWVVDNKLVLFTDNHRALKMDTIELTQDGGFVFEGHATGLDELYLCGEQGELCRFYASGDMEVNLSVAASVENGVKAQFLSSALDSINGWLQECNGNMKNDAQECRQLIEAKIAENPMDIRLTLMLRDQLELINDSLYVRQTLGGLKDEAKPDWLKKSFDATLSAMSANKNNFNRRLLNAAFETKDTIINLATSRSDYILVCFWADYSKPSIDTLRALANLISKDYDGKRVSFMSCCLHAEDSAMWRVRINFLDGQHTWVKGGFSDSRMRAWNIQQVPSVILMDMYCNQMQRNVWGGELRRALDRVPNRIGYQKK